MHLQQKSQAGLHWIDFSLLLIVTKRETTSHVLIQHDFDRSCNLQFYKSANENLKSMNVNLFLSLMLLGESQKAYKRSFYVDLCLLKISLSKNLIWISRMARTRQKNKI